MLPEGVASKSCRWTHPAFGCVWLGVFKTGIAAACLWGESLRRWFLLFHSECLCWCFLYVMCWILIKKKLQDDDVHSRWVMLWCCILKGGGPPTLSLLALLRVSGGEDRRSLCSMACVMMSWNTPTNDGNLTQWWGMRSSLRIQTC